MALASALVLLLGGCAPAVSTSGGTRVPTAGTQHRIPQEVARSDVDPETSGPLTLAQLLSFALTHAPAVAVARQRAKMGDAEVEGARTLNPYNPKVAVSAGGRTAGGVSRFEFGAEVQQQFEVGGERGTRIEAAERSREARLAEVDVVRWRLQSEVRGLYYKLLVREKQLVVTGQIEDFTKSIGEIIDKRVNAGEESPLETIMARASVAKARRLVIVANQAYRATSLRLAEVVGWPATMQLEVSGKLAQPDSIRDHGQLIQIALNHHPGRRWLGLEVRAAQARIEREDRAAWPDPAVGFSYGREAEAGGAAHVWLGTIRVPLPVWERNQAARSRARAALDLVRAEQTAFETTLRVRIAAAVARVNAAAESVKVYDTDILPAFEGNLTKLQRAFELGEIDVLQLSLVQQRILVTQQDALNALNDYYDGLAALEALLGTYPLSMGAEQL